MKPAIYPIIVLLLVTTWLTFFMFGCMKMTDDTSGLIISNSGEKKTDIGLFRLFKDRTPFNSGGGTFSCGYTMDTGLDNPEPIEVPSIGLMLGSGYFPLFTGISKKTDDQGMEFGKTYPDFGYFKGYPVSVKVEAVGESQIHFTYLLDGIPEDIISFFAKTIIDTSSMTWTYQHSFVSNINYQDIIGNEFDTTDPALVDLWEHTPSWQELNKEEMTGSGVFYDDGIYWGSGKAKNTNETYEDGNLLWSYNDSISLEWSKDSEKLIVKGESFEHQETDEVLPEEITGSGYFSPVYDDFLYSITYYHSGENKGNIVEDSKTIQRYCAPLEDGHNIFWAYEGNYMYDTQIDPNNEIIPEDPKLVTFKSIQKNHSLYKTDCSGTESFSIMDYYWETESQSWIKYNQFSDSYELPPCYNIDPEDTELPEHPIDPPLDDPGIQEYFEEGILTILLTNFPDPDISNAEYNYDVSLKTIYIELNSSGIYYDAIGGEPIQPEPLLLSLTLPENTTNKTEVLIQTENSIPGGHYDIIAWIDYNDDGDIGPTAGDFQNFDFVEVNGDVTITIGEKYGEDVLDGEFWFLF